MNNRFNNDIPIIKDYGDKPFIFNIDRFTKLNRNYRTAIWTGKDMQITLMSIRAGGDIGLEMHPDVEQFIRIESGRALVMMGKEKNKLDYQRKINSDYAVVIPTGTWHNIINIGRTPLKLYSVYAPPQHPFGTVHETKEIAEQQGD